MPYISCYLATFIPYMLYIHFYLYTLHALYILLPCYLYTLHALYTFLPLYLTCLIYTLLSLYLTCPIIYISTFKPLYLSCLCTIITNKPYIIYLYTLLPCNLYINFMKSSSKYNLLSRVRMFQENIYLS